MKRIALTLITALIWTTAAAQDIPTSLTMHMRHLAGNASFIEFDCDEYFASTSLDVPSLCFFPNQSTRLAMNGIDLYVDWASRMSPADIAHPRGAWTVDGPMSDDPMYSRLFITQSGEWYAIHVFNDLVVMSYIPD